MGGVLLVCLESHDRVLLHLKAILMLVCQKIHHVSTTKKIL
jgi:hypothetical protein